MQTWLIFGPGLVVVMGLLVFGFFCVVCARYAGISIAFLDHFFAMIFGFICLTVCVHGMRI